jgi:hypothetical protein
MPDRRLPDHPDIGQLKHQAKDLLRNIRRGEPAAVAALKKHHPGPIEAASVKLADAQYVLARTYGAPSWPRLVFACRLIDAIWREDVELLREMGKKDPELLHAIAASPEGQTLLESRIATRQGLHELAGKLPRPPKGAMMGMAETLDARGMTYLLEMGAEICDASDNRLAPVALVLETYSRYPEGKHGCLEALARYGVELPDTPPMAVHRGRIDLLEAHLRRDGALLARTFSHREIYPPELGCHAEEFLTIHGTPLAGGTLMQLAIDYGEIAIARWLIDRGMDLNARATIDAEGFGGHTALFSTVVSYYYYVQSKYAAPKPDDDPFARLLLDGGADPNVRASLRKRIHENDSVHEYRDVTPLEWGQRFYAQELVSKPAMRLIAERIGQQ